MNKIQQIQDAIARADRFESKLTPEALAVPMLGSLKIRHLLNNLGAISTRYFEIGSHRGGSFCSATFANELLTAGACDNFSEFINNENTQQDFLNNVGHFCPKSTAFYFFNKDCFSLQTIEIPGPIDLYLYDGDHSSEAQEKGITYFKDAMADEFILCVDDYSWIPVRKGTEDGIKKAGLTILFEQELISVGEPNMSYHNGFYVALLSK